MKIEAAKREAEEAVSPIKEGFAQITGKIFEAAGEMADKPMEISDGFYKGHFSWYVQKKIDQLKRQRKKKC